MKRCLRIGEAIEGTTMNDTLKKLIAGQPVTDEDIASDLYEVCSSVHASCDNECPVFEKFSGIPKRTKWGKEYGCDCFKDGNRMLAFLRKVR